jgi:membrane associated rhomboid family serine protease
VSYRRYQDAAATAVWVLIAANVLVYIATSLIPGGSFGVLSNAIVDQFGVSRSTISSQPWTIVTSLFLHDGIYHILGNMLMLYIYGSYLSTVINETRLLLLYFIGGLVGNALFLLIAPPFAAAVGASGAIFALGGALAVLRPKIKVVLFPIPIPMDLWVYVLMSAVLLGVLPALSQFSTIGWQAHIGGLVTGLAAGWYFRRWERSRGIYR